MVEKERETGKATQPARQPQTVRERGTEREESEHERDKETHTGQRDRDRKSHSVIDTEHREGCGVRVCVGRGGEGAEVMLWLVDQLQ